MDVVILCGGEGSRFLEETEFKPKPMIKIGDKPILWYIMKLYSYYGFNRFILSLGYKSEVIKKYFFDYQFVNRDFKLDFNSSEKIEYLQASDEKDWEVLCVDTGEKALKGARIKRIEEYIQTNNFHLTYGDGVGNVNLNYLSYFHRAHKKIGTVTSVRPPSRFGELTIDKNNNVKELKEKSQMGEGIINGGFFIFNKKIFSYLNSDDDCDFEFGALQNIVNQRELRSYEHNGFWQCMDNKRDKLFLDNLIKNNQAPWVVW